MHNVEPFLPAPQWTRRHAPYKRAHNVSIPGDGQRNLRAALAFALVPVKWGLRDVSCGNRLGHVHCQ